MPKRVVCYVRISTTEQKQGYSVADQERVTREHAERNGWELVEVIRDEGFSGASVDRPGLSRILSLSEAGEIDTVLASKRDRLFRSRLYRLMWDQDLADYGVELVSLNDIGLTMGDGLLDEFAAYEREQITQRMMSGKIQKARSGKIVAGAVPNFGFRFSEDRNYYEIDESTMISVRRLFALVASGESLSATARILNAEDLPAPGKRWIRHTVRQMVLDDVYRPHAPAEANEMVSLGQMTPVVSEGLTEPFGVWWFNRTVTTKRRGKVSVKEKPPGEWVAVPVPDSGIPRKTVDVAREIVSGNELRPKSTAGGREWELSGGIIRCSGCGNAMLAVGSVAYRELKSGTKKYHLYNYRCDTKRRDGECPYGKTISARKAEAAVWEAVSSVMLEPERLQGAMEEVAKAKTRKPNPKRRKSILKLTDDLSKKRDGLIDLAADGIISKDELSRKLKSIDAQLSTLRSESDSLRGRESETEDVRMILRGLKTQAPKLLENLSPDQKRRLYLDLGLKVYFEPGKLSLSWMAGVPMGEIELKYEPNSRLARENTLKIYASVSLSGGSWVFSVA